jgi:DNA topoisomerase VI subunit B
MTEAKADTYAEFKDAVNMSASELEKWLKTDESKQVGQKSGEGAESVGHDSGRKIIKILHTKKADLTDADEAHMRKVVGYVHRHLAQRPKGDVENSKWRYSLMNWGHDPLKD